MKTQLSQSDPFPEEQFFPGQGQLPTDAVQQVMALSRSLFGDMAEVFALAQDRRLHSNHLFPRAHGYSPHHCPTCGLVERGMALLFAHYGHVGAFVRRILRDPALSDQATAAVRLLAWVVVQLQKELGLARDPGEQHTRAAHLLSELVPERFVVAQWADEIGSLWEAVPLLFALDEVMVACVQEFVDAYGSLARAFDRWRDANPTRCPALFAWVEVDNA
jgi:hypothetical protein